MPINATPVKDTADTPRTVFSFGLTKSFRIEPTMTASINVENISLVTVSAANLSIHYVLYIFK